MMKCPKCGGLMNFEEFLNVASDGMPWSYEGWRCLDCGEIIDPLILLNREASKAPSKERATAGAGRGNR